MVKNRMQESQLRIELLKVLKDQEAFWSQRYQIQWISEGDRNTKFFHRVVSTRKSNNLIKGIQISRMGDRSTTNQKYPISPFPTIIHQGKHRGKLMGISNNKNIIIKSNQ